jgi:hypothetical protein
MSIDTAMGDAVTGSDAAVAIGEVATKSAGEAFTAPTKLARGRDVPGYVYVVTKANPATCIGAFKHIGAATRCFVKDLVEVNVSLVTSHKWMKLFPANTEMGEQMNNVDYNLTIEIKRHGERVIMGHFLRNILPKLKDVPSDAHAETVVTVLRMNS